MSYQPQLFIGKLPSVSPLYDNVIAITGTTVSGQDTITSVAAFNSSFDTSLLRVGQVINTVGTGFATNVTITEIDGTTLTVSSNANTSQTGGIFTVDMPAGTYFINSASFSDPQNNVDVNDITGSNDADYDGTTPIYGIVGQASSTLGGSAISGKFHLYKITEITYRDIGSSEFSAFISWGEQGQESDSNEVLFTGASQTLAIGAMSTTSSQVTIYGDDIILGTPAGSDIAPYQITLPEVIDQAITSSTGFPFTGSAQITGSLAVTGSSEFIIPVGGETDNFIITSGSGVGKERVLNVTSEGVVQFFAQDNSYEPTAVLGGIYFTSASAFIGVE
jgi:hypothetical protein